MGIGGFLKVKATYGKTQIAFKTVMTLFDFGF
jgi:hypothetical protein